MNIDLKVLFQEKKKDGAHVINLDSKNSNGKHWISIFFDRNKVIYFDSFGIEYIPQDVLNKIWANLLLTIYLEYKIMNLRCVDFIASLS